MENLMFKIVAPNMLRCSHVGVIASSYEGTKKLILWSSSSSKQIEIFDVCLGLGRLDFVPEVAMRVWRV